MFRLVSTAASALLMALCAAWPAAAQTGETVRIERTSPVLERPRGDSVVLGSVQADDVVQLIEQQGAWYLIAVPPERAATSSWQRGWIRLDAVDPDDRPAAPAAARGPARPAPRGPTRIRGFVQAGGVLFTARDSFEAVLDGAFGPIYGGGAQVVLPSGGFIQGSFERFSDDGYRVVVSADQVFALPIPTTITVTPVQVTFGYRVARAGATAPYLGAGFGVYRYREDTPTLPDVDTLSRNHFSFHLLGGAEYRVAPWVSIAGEAQWAGVPKALGDEGVSLVFDEDDLGGGTFRVKIIIGR